MRQILPAKICVALTVVLGLVSTLSAQNYTARLDLEQSTDGLKSWQRVPMTAGMLNNGSVDLSTVTSSAFYRMKIVVTQNPTWIFTLGPGVLNAGSAGSGLYFSENAFQQINLNTVDSSHIAYFYNNWDNSTLPATQTTYVFVNGVVKAIITFTSDRLGDQFGYSTSGTTPQAFGTLTLAEMFI